MVALGLRGNGFDLLILVFSNVTLPHPRPGVIPAQAGIHLLWSESWIPAFAGMTDLWKWKIGGILLLIRGRKGVKFRCIRMTALGLPGNGFVLLFFVFFDFLSRRHDTVFARCVIQ